MIFLALSVMTGACAMAQTKFYVYQNDGTSAEFAIANVDSLSFTEPTTPGTLPGAFSVSATKQVNFSKGNLQYQASTETWRFAENQYDMIGAANSNISSTYNGWIDLFGWGTSGYDNKYPYMTSATNADYGDGEKDIAGTDYDWGVYNAISNGGNSKGLWRTLTTGEWQYLFKSRDGYAAKYSQGTVNSVHGLILLPDSWTLPAGCNFTAKAANWTTNAYNTDNWAKMQTAGAVFLPAAGYRDGTDVYFVGDYGYYWSSSYYLAYSVYFDEYGVDADGSGSRCCGQSVRLAKDL